MRWTLAAGLLLAGAADAGTLDDFMELRVGSFTSSAQAARDDRYDVAIWHIAEIWQDDNRQERWLYSESWLDGAEAPYMQRVSKVVERDDGVLVATRYRPHDPDQLLGSWRDGAKVIGRDDLRLHELQGCQSLITRAGRDRFEGSTTGNQCRNAYKGASYAISRSVVTNAVSTNWDRGFDAAGNLVWGPPQGGYQFRRVGDDACVQPVRMLVYGSISDRSKFGAYGRALGESGLYPKNGGYYEAITPPLAVFEGEPGENRGVIIARFPCLQAAKDFWYSDAYQAIRPLREGIADFEVIVLREPPVPDYLDWN